MDSRTARAAYLLQRAAAVDYPELRVNAVTTIPAGQEAWETYTAAATLPEVNRALERLGQRQTGIRHRLEASGE
ncbi:MAG: hypothetical protein ACO1SX_24985 [Actinomycetota bacterium]